MPERKMKIIKNPATVEDRDLKKAYELALKFLESERYKIEKVKMGISPFAPTYEKFMIIHITPSPKKISELIELEDKLQKKAGKEVGISLS